MPFMTIPIAMGLAAAGSTGVSLYQSHKAGKQNDRVLSAQERDAERAEALEREDMQRRENARRESMEFDRQRWGDYVGARQPHWQFGGNLLGGLYKMMGMSGGSTAQSPMAAQPSYATPPALSAMTSGAYAPRQTTRTRSAIGDGMVPMPTSGGNPLESAMSIMSLAKAMEAA